MFLIYSWGKKLLKRKYLGRRYCSHCGGFTNHYTYDHVSQFALFFIPIARWKRKHYVLCTNCNQGVELTKEGIMEIERQYLFMPSEAVVKEMLLETQSMAVKETNKESIIMSLENKYNDERYKNYIESMVEQVCAVRKYEMESM